MHEWIIQDKENFLLGVSLDVDGNYLVVYFCLILTAHVFAPATAWRDDPIAESE